MSMFMLISNLSASASVSTTFGKSYVKFEKVMTFMAMAKIAANVIPYMTT